MTSTASNPNPANRRPQLIAQLQTLFEEVAGLDLAGTSSDTSFVELGLDSLTLTQAALQVKKQFSVALTFRQLMEKYRSFDSLAEFLDAQLPRDFGRRRTCAGSACRSGGGRGAAADGDGSANAHADAVRSRC